MGAVPQLAPGEYTGGAFDVRVATALEQGKSTAPPVYSRGAKYVTPRQAALPPYPSRISFAISAAVTSVRRAR